MISETIGATVRLAGGSSRYSRHNSSQVSRDKEIQGARRPERRAFPSTAMWNVLRKKSRGLTDSPVRRKHCLHTALAPALRSSWRTGRSEEHTSELQSLRHL